MPGEPVLRRAGRSSGRPPLPSAEQFRRWGVDPSWSRLVPVTGVDGVSRKWHVLDTGAPPGSIDATTIVCVHGNPTWSFSWRSFLRTFGDRYRVVAVDQLGMGYSERTSPRGFAQRVDDLGDAIDALDVRGPVVVAAHDWGGPIALGWVLRNRARVQAMVLCNTGVAVPDGRKAPAIIRLAASGPITDLVCRRTRVFLDGTLALSGRRVARVARRAYRAPYRRAADRAAIAEFVADIPFDDHHPSAAAIGAVAEGIRALEVPVLLAWGAADPVFDDDFALDLAARMPHAVRQRLAGFGHLVVEEADIAGLVDEWLSASSPTPPAEVPPHDEARTVAPIWEALDRRRDDDAIAFVDGATGLATTFAELHRRTTGLAAGLAAKGVAPGDRVAVLVEPGIDLLATVYGCWRCGAVTVIADRGLGLGGLGRAMRAARPRWIIGAPRALAVATALRWAPRAGRFSVGGRRLPGTIATLSELFDCDAPLPADPAGDAPAAVLYTSGATGPAKGVRYTHEQIARQRDALRALYRIGAADRLVAAFAPFALYGPALGITSTIPDVDVTSPGALTCAALGDAVASIGATVVFASPAALANVVRTAPAEGDPRLSVLRLVLSAGAPVPVATLLATQQLCPGAELHTPYGMTECLPVSDIDLGQIATARSTTGGVCVGPVVPGANVLVAALGFDPTLPVGSVPSGETGEILVRAPWVSAGYDQLWRIEHAARPVDPAGRVWHRTGDVGHLDANGLLWVEGRSVHVIDADPAPITPVPVEVAVQRLEGVERAAAVGVGPSGCQQLVVVVEGSADGLADPGLATAVRAAVDHPVAAVLTVRRLPVDIRHNTKVDRTAVARWAGDVLAGRRERPSW